MTMPFQNSPRAPVSTHTDQSQSNELFNPLITPTPNISGIKSARTRLRTVYFPAL